jgi:TIGR04076 family protein
MMGDCQEQQVKVEVIESQCKLYQPGDQIIINGPIIDTASSDKVCVTALQAIYPFIFAMRKGVTPAEMGFDKELILQCPDYCGPVLFQVKPLK